jgi:hypothetical protein
MLTTILDEARKFHTLQEALRWASAKEPPFVVASVVAQDEFTHDVVFRVAEDGFLVFDTT